MRAVSWGDLASYVRRERRRRRQYQDEFAAEIGISARTVGKIESGHPNRYDADTIASIESAMDWRPGEFERVIETSKPPERRYGDPDIARLMDAWPRLHPKVRTLVADVVARLADM